MTDDVTFYDEIEAYCGRLSYRPGEAATVHVSTQCDRFDLTVERWGASRQVVWQAEAIGGAYHPAPPDADAVGCGWPSSVEVPIPEGWSSGFYLVTATAHGAAAGRNEAHAFFVVRPDGPPVTGRALFMLSTNTWNAYNTWGGKSLYTGGNEVSFRRPMGRGMLCRPEVDRDDRKARPTRWGEEPDVDGDRFQEYRFAQGYPASIGSAGWYGHERRFAEWAETAGYHLDYCISSDLDDDPTILEGYDLLIDIGHDEYWTAPQRATVEAHVRDGGNLASLSGNTMFWQVRLEGDAADTGATMVCHKYSAQSTDPIVGTQRESEMSGMWCDPVVNQPEWTLLGAGSAWGLYNRFGQATPRGSGAFTVYRDNHWLLAGTGLRYGDLLGARDGVVGYETLGCRIDLDDLQLPIARYAHDSLDPHSDVRDLPSAIEIVAMTPSSNLGVGEYPASISALNDQGDLEFIATRLFGGLDDESLARARYGNAVMLTCRPFGDGGGEVVTIGTTDWVFGLAGDPAVGRVTANICDRYLAPSG